MPYVPIVVFARCETENILTGRLVTFLAAKINARLRAVFSVIVKNLSSIGQYPRRYAHSEEGTRSGVISVRIYQQKLP